MKLSQYTIGSNMGIRLREKNLTESKKFYRYQLQSFKEWFIYHIFVLLSKKLQNHHFNLTVCLSMFSPVCTSVYICVTHQRFINLLAKESAVLSKAKQS